jgi:hypothetical protein
MHGRKLNAVEPLIGVHASLKSEQIGRLPMIKQLVEPNWFTVLTKIMLTAGRSRRGLPPAPSWGRGGSDLYGQNLASGEA